MSARVYEFPNGTLLRCIDGEGLGDDPDLPIPYRLTEADVDPSLEQRVARAEETAEVWQDTARQFARRCEAMLTDLQRLTGRSRAALLAQYVPEATGGATEPV